MFLQRIIQWCDERYTIPSGLPSCGSRADIVLPVGRMEIGIGSSLAEHDAPFLCQVHRICIGASLQHQSGGWSLWSFLVGSLCAIQPYAYGQGGTLVLSNQSPGLGTDAQTWMRHWKHSFIGVWDYSLQMRVDLLFRCRGSLDVRGSSSSALPAQTFWGCSSAVEFPIFLDQGSYSVSGRQKWSFGSNLVSLWKHRLQYVVLERRADWRAIDAGRVTLFYNWTRHIGKSVWILLAVDDCLNSTHLRWPLCFRRSCMTHHSMLGYNDQGFLPLFAIDHALSMYLPGRMILEVIHLYRQTLYWRFSMKSVVNRDGRKESFCKVCLLCMFHLRSDIRMMTGLTFHMFCNCGICKRHWLMVLIASFCRICSSLAILPFTAIP